MYDNKPETTLIYTDDNGDDWDFEKLITVYRTGMRLRQTAVVDDEFPEMMSDFDFALAAVTKRLNNV